MDKISVEGRQNKIHKGTSAASVFILAGICLFQVIHNCIWIKQDVLSWYPEKYYQLIYKNLIFFPLQNIIHSSQSWSVKVVSLVKLLKSDAGWGWGTIFYLYTASINALFGNSIGVSLLSNLPFFILLIIFTFLIGKEISGEKTGLLAAFLVSFYPGIYGMSRSYGVDFPLVALVTLSSYVLIAKDITKIKYLLLFVLVLQLTLFIKATGILFLIAPLLWIFYQHIRQVIKNKAKADFPKNLILLVFSLAVLFIVTPLLNFGWGSGLLSDVAKQLNLLTFLAFSHRRHFYDVCLYSTTDIRNISFYAQEIMHSISRTFFVLFCTGFLFLLQKKIKHKMIIYLWAVIPYIIFTLMVNKWGRYYFPALPALALISAAAVFQLRSKKFRLILVALIVALSLVQFYDLSFGSSILPKNLYRHPDYSFVAYPPEKSEEAKAVSGFMETIDKECKGANYKCRILLVAPHGKLIDSGKMEYIFQTKYPGVEFTRFFWAGPNYQNCDYIIVINYSWNGTHKPDIEFLKTPGYYGDFLKVSYPQDYLSDEKLGEMHDFFAKFKAVDSFFGKDLFFYLCKNPQQNTGKM
jgi:Dolichyl-phosphate-mannose-protein mannosyltransferase